MVILTVSLWISSSRSRSHTLLILKTLDSQNQIPLTGDAYNLTSPDIKERAINLTKGTLWEKAVAGSDKKDGEGKDLVLVSDVVGATWSLIKSELGDKTFIIILIFTLGWSNPLWANEVEEGKKRYVPGYAVFADGT